MVGWQSASARSLEQAQKDDKPILIFFPAKDGQSATDGFIYGEPFKKLADEKAVFVRVTHCDDRTPAPFSDESPIPCAKLAGDNPSRDYKVTQYPCFIVADKYGNEVRRVTGTKAPTVKELEAWFAEVPAKVAALEGDLKKNLEAAQKAWEKKNAKEVIKVARKNFEKGVFGLESQQQTIRLYNEALDSVRADIKGLDAQKDAGKLKGLEREFKGTEIAAEIREILGSK
ncbi:MAG: hypothetical protein IT462_13695 [Planctomycetes bacterium]|nr:hypothetical protein [Planctomycetota bacterium]